MSSSTVDASLVSSLNNISFQLNRYLAFPIFLFGIIATLGRWGCSSIKVSYRHWSTLKNAQRGISLLVIISSLLQIQQIFCYEANLTYTPLKCYSKTVTCGILSDLSFALITVLIPLLLMFIFGRMIILNVRYSQSRLYVEGIAMSNSSGILNPVFVNVRQLNQRRKTDRRLLSMLFVQVIFILVLTLPFAISKLYSTLTRDILKSTLQITIESFIFNLFLLFLNVASGMPFYIYTLTGGKVFRKALLNLFHK
ncbi:unnamed protein product [Adineta ricciae]|uniref:G-protein coupled receptors family 1 profile domain-containing protein n=1 Tax=Adineta ricciae TaxID=249248 RepID=A0A815WSQ0_ADIRI|nr:unnamed protein product [Adineta ricciae]CAF1549190.1 unnamed protein product [Adineta ricciae]